MLPPPYLTSLSDYTNQNITKYIISINKRISSEKWKQRDAYTMYYFLKRVWSMFLDVFLGSS
ncbi:hypothetical protein Hanom_Chr12g01170021 [Helianthus anomalus]